LRQREITGFGAAPGASDKGVDGEMRMTRAGVERGSQTEGDVSTHTELAVGWLPGESDSSV
jgi:hypothetical protein